jgi:hypothetical protein
MAASNALEMTGTLVWFNMVALSSINSFCGSFAKGMPKQDCWIWGF